MTTIPESSGENREGFRRRDLFKLGALSALGLASSKSFAEDSRRALSCIVIWLQGGISHLDTFDPKPKAQSEFRGEFAAIQTKVPGIFLSEHLPKLAMQADKFSIIRGLDPQNGTHGIAEAYLLSGHPYHQALCHPSFGAMVSHRLGGRDGLPASVQIGHSLDTTFGGGRAGFLGTSFDPHVISAPTILTSERPKLLDEYGHHSLGRSCVMARQLIESGVRFVTVTDGGWDTHRDNFRTLRDDPLPRLDSALSALLQDLSDRGRLDSTLVMVLSDFGRTPRVNALAGRDHWSSASVALVAGAGLRAGVVVGGTDSRGESAVDAPYRPEDLAATLSNRLGIPGNSDGRLIRELF